MLCTTSTKQAKIDHLHICISNDIISPKINFNNITQGDNILKIDVILPLFAAYILPSYDYLRVFGSLCYAQNRLKDHGKFASRSRGCIFVGYPYGKKAWNCIIWKQMNILRVGKLYFMKKYSLSRMNALGH